MPRIEVRVGPDQGSPAPLQVGDRQLVDIPIRIRNTGTEPVHWLHLVPKDVSQAPFLFLPPPRLVKLDPGAEHLFTARVSFATAYEQPAPVAATLELALAMDQGEPIPIRVPVAGLAAQPEVVVSLEQVADLRTLTLRLTNRGGWNLQDLWVSARVSSPRGDADLQLLEMTNLGPLPAGGVVPLSFVLPDAVKLDAGSRLILELEERTNPMHRWRFMDLPIAIAILPRA